MLDGMLVPILGKVRLWFVGVLLGCAVFLFIAMGQGYHFGWGFKYLEIAIRFGVYLTVLMVIETLLIARRLWPQKVRSGEVSRQQEVELLCIYLIAIWVVWGLYVLKMFS
jgi:hypothetical protein